MKKSILTIALVTSLFSNEFREFQKIDVVDRNYKDIRYFCLGGLLHFIKSETYKNTIIMRVINPRSNFPYKCQVHLKDVLTGITQIEILGD